jgi:hypothetical protein
LHLPYKECMSSTKLALETKLSYEYEH